MNSNLVHKIAKGIINFKEVVFGLLILTFGISIYLDFGLFWGILGFTFILSVYYFYRIKKFQLFFNKHQYKFICDPTTQTFFVHSDIPHLIENTIKEIALKNNFKEIPVQIIESDEDGAFCSYYTDDSYQIELTTFSLYNIGATPGKKITNKTKKRLKAILAHEYGHFYHNDGFIMEFILLTQLFFVILLLMNYQFTLVFIPFFIASLYSKFIEYRADYFSWRMYPEATYLELKEAGKNNNTQLSLIHRIRLILFGSHPSDANRIRFINYKKAKK